MPHLPAPEFWARPGLVPDLLQPLAWAYAAAGARAAIAAGVQCLLLDDGLQNPTLAKDLSLLVIDGAYGLGNGRVLPAGPLREPLQSGLARADAVVLMGEDRAGVTPLLAGKTVLRARLAPENAAALAGRAVVAFAGIGRPAKFFTTLERIGARLAARHAFPDHHPQGRGTPAHRMARPRRGALRNRRIR